MDDRQEKVQGYTIQRSILFENNRGFALGENPNAPQPFVTWMFTENENGKRDYYWGHYTKSDAAALRDYEDRAATLEKDYGLSEKGVYKYYSTQRPVDLGTFPKTENGPKRIVNFDAREQVETGHYQAWGYLIYHEPLTKKQIADYELQAAPGNPDVKARMAELAQVIGAWEEKIEAPDGLRFTTWSPQSKAFFKKGYIMPEAMEDRYRTVLERQVAHDQRKKPPIVDQIKEAAKQATCENKPPKQKKDAPDKGDR